MQSCKGLVIGTGTEIQRVRDRFEEVFPSTNVQVEVYGNVMAATAFLQGLSTQELKKEELDYCDSGYQVLITVRAMKPEAHL
jgi:hypothetical protein